MKLVTNDFDSISDENFRINLSSIKLTKKQILQIKSKVRTLEMLAPVKSFLTIDLEKSENKIKGSLIIKGNRRTFNSTAEGQCPIQIYNLLEINIKKQLRDWKKTRFITQNTNMYDDHTFKNLTGGYAV